MHDVLSVYEQLPGSDDAAILERAVSEGRILVTADKDFGELIFRDGRRHSGVILLRLNDERSASKVAVLDKLLKQYAVRLEGSFVVATEANVRITPAVGE